MKAAELMIKKFLIAEKKTVISGKELIIKSVEEKLHKHISINTKNEENKTVKIVGIADRIDNFDKKLRIIDYKTSKLKITRTIVIDDLVNLFKISGQAHALQVMTYQWMIDKKNVNSENIISGIYQLGKRQKELVSLTIKDEKNQDVILDAFEDELKRLLQEIYDQNIPFTQTKNLKNCEATYCTYRTICGR